MPPAAPVSSKIASTMMISPRTRVICPSPCVPAILIVPKTVVTDAQGHERAEQNEPATDSHHNRASFAWSHFGGHRARQITTRGRFGDRGSGSVVIPGGCGLRGSQCRVTWTLDGPCPATSDPSPAAFRRAPPGASDLPRSRLAARRVGGPHCRWRKVRRRGGCEHRAVVHQGWAPGRDTPRPRTRPARRRRLVVRSSLGIGPVDLECVGVIQGAGVTHLTYRVMK
jgi:hypothetical protein